MKRAGLGRDTVTRTLYPGHLTRRDFGPYTPCTQVAAYRIRVKKDSSLGHVREIERDLGHLERTISERPPLVAKKGAGVVDEKVHDLVDEAWSLGADPAFGEDRRALTGRTLALAAALDWPAAAEEAAAVLDGVLRKTPLRADAILARAAVYLLAGDSEKAITLAEAAKAIPDVSPRVHYLLGRALLAEGKQADGLAELRRYREAYPYDALAARLGEEARAGKLKRAGLGRDTVTRTLYPGHLTRRDFGPYTPCTLSISVSSRFGRPTTRHWM